MHTCALTCTHMYSTALTLTLHAHALALTCTHIHMHSHSPALASICTHTYLALTCTHLHSHSPALALTCTQLHSHSPCTHVYSPVLALNCTRTRLHSHSPALALTCTRTHLHSHSHSTCQGFEDFLIRWYCGLFSWLAFATTMARAKHMLSEFVIRTIDFFLHKHDRPPRYRSRQFQNWYDERAEPVGTYIVTICNSNELPTFNNC